jgi:hypothetical protein
MSGAVDALPGAKPARARPRFGITGVDVRGFRTARDVFFSPGPLCALVGEADAGKSNLLAAMRAVLDPAAAPLTPADVAEGGDGQISIRVELADGGEASLKGCPGRTDASEQNAAPPVLFLPAEARGGPVLSGGSERGKEADEAVAIFERAFGERGSTSGGRALSLVDALESCCARRVACSQASCPALRRDDPKRARLRKRRLAALQPHRATDVRPVRLGKRRGRDSNPREASDL